MTFREQLDLAATVGNVHPQGALVGARYAITGVMFAIAALDATPDEKDFKLHVLELLRDLGQELERP